MPLWKTDDIIKMCSLPGCSVEVEEPGGDYDTSAVIVKFDRDPDDGLIIYGMGDFWEANTEALTNAQRDEVQLQNVILRNIHSDSDGGIQTSDPAIASAGAAICGLLQQAGFSIHRHWDQL